MTATGVSKLTSCQPLGVSMLNAFVASNWPPLDHRRPDVRAGVRLALVEPHAGNETVCGRCEPDAQFDRRVIAAVDLGRRSGIGEQAIGRAGCRDGREAGGDVGSQSVSGNVLDATRPAASDDCVGDAVGQ